MTNIQINGTGFLVSQLEPTDQVVVDLGDSGGNQSGNSLSFYDPNGPNGGSNLGSFIPDAWTNSRIEFSYDQSEGYPGEHVVGIRLYDESFNLLETHEVSPAQPQANTPPNGFDIYYDAGSDTLTIYSPDGELADIVADPGGATDAQVTFEGVRTDSGPFSGSLRAYDFTTLDDYTGTVADAWDSFFFAQPTDSIEITSGAIYDASFTELAPWNGSVTVIQQTPVVNDAQATGVNTVTIYGEALTSADYWRLIDDFDFDTSYYDSAGPNAGLNPVGATVTVVDQYTVTIEHEDLAGLDITYIQTHYFGGLGLHEWYGSTGTVVDASYYPIVESICSPAPDTVRIVGQRFQTAGAGAVGYTIPRGTGAIFSGPQTQHEFADGSPDAYGWSLLEFTDNVIELHNPNFDPGDVMTGVAFHTADAIAMYYYEPWDGQFSTPVDGSGNCSGLAQPIVLSASSDAVGRVTIEGAGFLTATDGPPSFAQVFVAGYGGAAFDGPNAGTVGEAPVSWTDTQIVVDLAEWGFPDGFTFPATVDQVEISGDFYDLFFDVDDFDVMIPAEPIIDGANSPNSYDEVRVFGSFLQNASLGPFDKFTVTTIEDGDIDFYIPSSPNVGLNPPSTGYSGVTDTEWTVSAPILIGKTVTSVALTDVDEDYEVVLDVADFLVG